MAHVGPESALGPWGSGPHSGSKAQYKGSWRRALNDHINIGILQTMISGIPLVLGPGTRI